MYQFPGNGTLLENFKHFLNFWKGHNREKEQASVHDAMREFASVAQKSFVAVFEKTRFLSVSVEESNRNASV